jgi:hypothetical protein
MTYLQEYDLDIRLVNIFKGQGLCKLAAKSMVNKNDEDELYEDKTLLEKDDCYIHVNIDLWYYEMKYYLTHGRSPQYTEPKKKIVLRLKSAQYHIS